MSFFLSHETFTESTVVIPSGACFSDFRILDTSGKYLAVVNREEMPIKAERSIPYFLYLFN